MAATEDRYARAVTSRDLTPSHEQVALDVIGAAAMAAQKAPTGMLLQRVRADTTRASFEAALTELAAMLKQQRMATTFKGALRQAEPVLRWWLDPTCPHCKGVRFDSINGRLQVRPCQRCQGSGRRAEPAGPSVRWLLAEIERQVERSARLHRVRLLRSS